MNTSHVRTFVVPDLHGRYDLAEQLLLAAGVSLKKNTRKAEGVRTVQLGDLANCVRDSAAADVIALQTGMLWFDRVLLGNHEYPHLGGPRFAGFYAHASVKAEIVKLLERGRLKPCHLVGDTFLSHAGLAAGWGIETPRSAYRRVKDAWRYGRGKEPLLAQIGRDRGGLGKYGGITWSDASEPRAPFSQVHGHTPNPSGPHVGIFAPLPDGPAWQVPRFRINLDVGVNESASRIVGLWLEEDGRPNMTNGWPIVEVTG